MPDVHTRCLKQHISPYILPSLSRVQAANSEDTLIHDMTSVQTLPIALYAGLYSEQITRNSTDMETRINFESKL